MEASKLHVPLLEPEISSSSSTSPSASDETHHHSSTSICTTFFSCRETPLCSNKNSLKSVLLVLLVIQGSSAILVGRFTRSSVPEDNLYEISHLVFVIECVKFLLSVIAECIVTRGRIVESVHEHILKRPLDSCKVLVPAILYVVQNSLVYIALSNLSAPVFISLQQGKLIATALVSVGMLQRTYSLKQWTCLFVLALGVAIIALDESSGHYSGKDTGASDSNDVDATDTDTEPEQFLVVGILAVTGACFSSAFAGVYFEKVLAPEKATRTIQDKSTTLKTIDVIKTQEVSTPAGPSLWMRNLQLSFFSILFCLLQGIMDWKMAIQVYNMEFDDDGAASSVTDDDMNDAKPYFHGFTGWVWVLVFLQAGGGLLVAAVMKWADNVLKGLAMGIGVVVASVVSTLLFHLQLSQQFVIGAFIICSSVYSFSNEFPTPSSCLPSMCKPALISAQG